MGGFTTRSKYAWGWLGPAPRGAPQASPIHVVERSSLASELAIAAKGTFWAQLSVEGRELRSAEIELPVVPLVLEEVVVNVRFTQARYLRPQSEEIEARFVPLSRRKGQLLADERSLTLPVGQGEHLLRAVRAKLRPDARYDCHPAPVRLHFARLRDPRLGGAPRLVLRRYELSAASSKNPLALDR